jgi:DNA-binding beta-propeller fold protein YncE
LFAPANAQAGFVHWESPHVHPLERTPDGARLLAVNTVDARLEVFSLASGSPVLERSIPVGLEPVSVRARSATEAWVVNHVSDSVSIVDLAQGLVVATLLTDDEPCDVVFAPATVPPLQRAFVTCSQPSTLLVFDAAVPATPPTRLTLVGEEPRALAYDATRGEVVVAFAESGNGTTILSGLLTTGRAWPPRATMNPLGPYGGVTPPPNSGASFDPPLNPALGPAPKTGLIVRRNALGEWRDDNIGDWTAFVSGAGAAFSGRPVGWTLLDHDLARIDATTLAIDYEGDLMNLVMAVAVNPVSGELTALGTDGRNEVRFEPNLNGTFLRVLLGRVDPGVSQTIVDLNPQLDYSSPTVTPATRELGLGDPRAIVWNSTGTLAFLAGMGSNNLLVVDASGSRVGTPLTVGEGPTGIALDEARAQLYVLNKFDATISVVSTVSQSEVSRVRFFDPSPTALKRGRRHLYDTHETSGTGIVSCASCHPDARTDRLAWDLGNPAGEELPRDEQYLQGGTGVELPWHPLKGPMLTQTLQDIIGKEPFHWRGDRDGIEDFNATFETLLGDDEQLSTAEMQEFEDFLATIWLPPNPFRPLDNSLPTNLPLPGHYSTGAFAPAGTPLPNGNAVNGKAIFRPPNVQDFEGACSSCHALPTTLGSEFDVVGGEFVRPPKGSDGESHHALIMFMGELNKVPQLRTLYERVGFEATQPSCVTGFGFANNGVVDSLARFVSDPLFEISTVQQVADLVAFLLCISGELEPPGPPTITPWLEAPGAENGKSVHAAIGAQVTLTSATPPPADDARLDLLVSLAESGAIGLVAHGEKDGLARGFAWRGPDLYQSDRVTETYTLAQLLALAGVGSELTFTAVPRRSELRLGLDRDLDGLYDRDEFDQGSDPADRTMPKARSVPDGRKP